MNRAIELHDSTLAALTVDGADVLVSFRPAYVHTSEGRPGVDRGAGWAQDIDLRISGAAIFGIPVAQPVKILGGRIWIDGELEGGGMVPLPLPASYHFELVLVLESDGAVAASGGSPQAVMVGEPRYLEDFPGPSA